jgi:hypothetical protein
LSANEVEIQRLNKSKIPTTGNTRIVVVTHSRFFEKKEKKQKKTIRFLYFKE